VGAGIGIGKRQVGHGKGADRAGAVRRSIC
jgi:hypothetical protein